jgi:aminopeptidase N
MRINSKLLATIFSCFVLSNSVFAQLGGEKPKAFTKADTLRGTLNADRTWFDVTHYAVYVKPDYAAKSITGNVMISFRVVSSAKKMQLDLQDPMMITAVAWNGNKLNFTKSGKVTYVDFTEAPAVGSVQQIKVEFAGNPVVAVRPPWDGGWIFSKDRKGNPWMSLACQGLGASVWFPCKDHQSDEPDSASLSMTVPDTLMAVGNGRLRSKTAIGDGTTNYIWAVTNPINSYNIIPYIGKYTNFTEDYAGEKGTLNCSYWVLDYNIEKARAQFTQVPQMLKCFESWFGPYPFYEDSYKLVESPHLGMEHQSAVAYGNGYRNGYLGRDLSNTGWGLKWDFIIIHESGHEWFGNSITSNDIADMWVHEGFTNYSETIFTTCQSGVQAGNEYVQGTRKLIANASPVVGKYGVNEEGSGDMYYKGGNLIHYVRQFFKDEEAFRMAMREMNKTFYHKTVNTSDIEKYWSSKTGKDLSKLFDQYLRDVRIPKLEYKIKGKTIQYRWADCISGYNIPVKIILNDKTTKWINPTTSWKKETSAETVTSLSADPNFYVYVEKLL